MKLLFSLGFITATVCFPMTVRAQDQAYELATNFSAQGNVIELDIPPRMDGTVFLIVWNTEHEQYYKKFFARAGTHCYEMRDLPSWQGHLNVVGITLPEVSGRIKKPTFFDEIDMFLEPERITLGTINFVPAHTLFGWSWNTVLLLVFLISAVCCATFKRKPFVVSVFLGFLVSWGMMDLRIMYNHAAVVYKMEKDQQGALSLTDVKVFADRASEIIGRATWGLGPLDGFASRFLRYRLAEHQYVPAGPGRSPAFWITQDPKEGEILWQHANQYLVKKN